MTKKDILPESELPQMSDNQIQQCEQCVMWILNNEELLNKL
jgi:hypothetical protein